MGPCQMLDCSLGWCEFTFRAVAETVNSMFAVIFFFFFFLRKPRRGTVSIKTCLVHQGAPFQNFSFVTQVFGLNHQIHRMQEDVCNSISYLRIISLYSKKKWMENYLTKTKITVLSGQLLIVMCVKAKISKRQDFLPCFHFFPYLDPLLFFSPCAFFRLN